MSRIEGIPLDSYDTHVFVYDTPSLSPKSTSVDDTVPCPTPSVHGPRMPYIPEDEVARDDLQVNYDSPVLRPIFNPYSSTNSVFSEEGETPTRNCSIPELSLTLDNSLVGNI